MAEFFKIWVGIQGSATPQNILKPQPELQPGNPLGRRKASDAVDGLMQRQSGNFVWCRPLLLPPNAAHPKLAKTLDPALLPIFKGLPILSSLSIKPQVITHVSLRCAVVKPQDSKQMQPLAYPRTPSESAVLRYARSHIQTQLGRVSLTLEAYPSTAAKLETKQEKPFLPDTVSLSTAANCFI